MECRDPNIRLQTTRTIAERASTIWSRRAKSGILQRGQTDKDNVIRGEDILRPTAPVLIQTSDCFSLAHISEQHTCGRNKARRIGDSSFSL